MTENRADIIIIGGGHAGTQCALAAIEDGASVIVVERNSGEKMTWSGEQVGHINSQFLISRGFGPYDSEEVIEEFYRCSAYRANRQLIAKYVRNSGEMMDHALSLIPPESNILDNSQCNVLQAYGDKCYPRVRGGCKSWAGTLQFRGSIEQDYDAFVPPMSRSRLPELERYSMQRSIALGADWRFSQRVEEVLIENGRAVGVRTRSADGSETIFAADKAIVLACGRHGDGQTLGLNAGGYLEDELRDVTEPFCVQNGTGAPFLTLNARGKRFMNEDIFYAVSPTIHRQMRGSVCTVTDSKWLEQVKLCGVHHGSPDFGRPEFIEQMQEDMSHVVSSGAEGYGVRDLAFSERMKVRIYGAETLEKLAEYLGYEGEDCKNWLLSIERYNALCYAGVDEDFGKSADAMIPIDEGPFYGAVTINRKDESCRNNRIISCPPVGFITDENFRMLNSDDVPIQGLYAVGDCLGQKYAVYYPSPIAGSYIGSAMTHGRVLGKQLAMKTVV